MRNKMITRILSLALACLLLVSGTAVSIGASEATGGNSVTSDMISDYQKELGTIPYLAYMEEYADYFKPGSPYRVTEDQVIDLGEMDLVFTSKTKDVIRIKDGAWSLTVNDKNKTVYTSVKDAVEQGKYDPADLVFITGLHYEVSEFEDQQVVYTPSSGETQWTLDLTSMGIGAEGALASIQFVYYPVLTLNGETIGKSAAIERQFALGSGLGVAAPFKESHALRFSKLWSSFRSDVSDENVALVAAYYPSKNETVASVIEEGKRVGISGVVKTDKHGAEFAEFTQPAVMTAARNLFIEKYELRFFTTDAENNELRPSMKQTPDWITYTLRDSSGFFADNFGFVLTPDEFGETNLVLEGINEPMALAQIILTPYEVSESYETYIANIRANVGMNAGTTTVKIEAESTSNASTNVVYPIEDRTSPITSPASTKKTFLNTIGAEKWATAGQWVEYQFSVDSSGLYDIVSRFKQSYLDGLYVNRSVQLFAKEFENEDAYRKKFNNTYGYYNGVPYAEAGAIRFDYDTDWQTTSLSDGNNTFHVYLEAGVVYTVRIEVTLGSMSGLVREVEDILNNLNADYLAILKLTGADPDDYRDYGFYRLLPNTIKNMFAQISRLEAISAMLKETAGVASTYSGICDQLTNLLNRMVKDEDEIAKNLDNYKSYVGSLGTFLTDAKTQPLQLDYIQIQPAGAELPKAEGNFFQRMIHEISAFFQSFFRDYNSMGAVDTDANAENIEVWMLSGAATDDAAYGRDQLQVVRNMCTNDFTNNVTQGKVSVDLKLVNGGTLLPSILAGLGPDVYMGLAQGNVINYAIRGALQEIEGLEGFEQVKAQFNDAAMIVFRMEDADDVTHYYGLPETQQFPMMFVRIDILADTGLDIPTTWDEIYNAQSVLQSKNMEIGLPVNYQLFLYQMGGELFADNGMRINLDSTIGETSFQKMCDLFTQYSFPYTYNAANRFRTGEMPIIISNYVTLYNQLKVFATELEGVWTFVPLPGMENKDPVTGETFLNNCSISSASASVMIKGTDKIDASWQYMKWFTGDYAQAEFSNEMVAIIGDSAKHSTANIAALENMPWTDTEYSLIKAQFDNLASVPNYPGSYILPRYTEFAFLAAYNDNEDPITKLRSYINTINKEISRKREEFKLEILEVGTTLFDKRLGQAEEAISVLKEQYNNAAYAELFAEAEAAFVNLKISNDDEAIEKRLRVVADMFKSQLPAEGEGTPSYFVRVSKQTAEPKNGGYEIDSLTEQQLLYFTAQCFTDAANALATY